MPASYAVALLRTAQDEGISQSDLMESVGTNKSTIQRIVNCLSEKGEGGTAGHALIEVRVAAHDSRVRTLHLAPKGRRLVANMLHHMEA